MTHIDPTASIRSQLKRAWVPFFTRFGKLTLIQQQAIPKILSSRNVVLASPTASGKTEAIIAPIAEKLLLGNWENLAVLFIVPTRALANDTLDRIENPLREMGITVTLKHGDKPFLRENELPHFLITTPESLDSLICRRPQAFTELRIVILDEIHLVDNTYRGDQLRILIRRLASLSKNEPLGIHLLSATLSDPHQIALRYAVDFEMIIVPGQRRIEYQLVGSQEELLQLAKNNGWKKALYFCNLRQSVESLGTYLSRLWHPYPVVAHHGSLNRRVREEAESVMKEANVAVCVATSTLEVGIDIGDIDFIVLAEVPWSISSLLQRIGRGNRKDETIQVVAVVASDEERTIVEAMFETAGSGELPPESYERDLSVSVQQILSFLFQHPEGVPEAELIQLLLPLCSENETVLILRHLRQSNWIEFRTGRWFASTRLMDKGEKGHVHSNIPDSQAYRVIDANTGREIGRVSGVIDEVFVLARRIWRVIHIGRDVITARPCGGAAATPIFRRCRNVGAFHYLLPAGLRS